MTKKTLVVLDFNGTILDSTHHRHAANIPVSAMARFKYVYYRPHMAMFIEWIMQQPNIVVALWTSNIATNAQSLADLVFTDEQRKRLLFTYSREQCVCFYDYSSKKPVQKIVDYLLLTEMISDFDQVLIVDDSPEKIDMCLSPQHGLTITYYHISTFEASLESLATDRGLTQLKEYIENYSCSKK